MKVKSMIARFKKSLSPDVVGYRLYIQEAPDPVGYNSDFWEVGDVVDGDTVVVDLASIPGMTTRDGVYNIGVAAVDDAGNLSSMSKKDGVALDFVAPDPPGEIELIGS